MAALPVLSPARMCSDGNLHCWYIWRILRVATATACILHVGAYDVKWISNFREPALIDLPAEPAAQVRINQPEEHSPPSHR